MTVARVAARRRFPTRYWNNGHNNGQSVLLDLEYRVDGIRGAKPGVEEEIVKAGPRKSGVLFEIGDNVVDRAGTERDVVALRYLHLPSMTNLYSMVPGST